MLGSHDKMLVRFIFAALLWLGAAGTASADAYYTVTDLGPYDGGNPQSLLPFPNTYGTLPQSDFASRPGVTGLNGATNTTVTFFPMQVMDYNSAGTVIGGVPSGSSRAIPYSSLTVGYAIVSPQGQWSAFTALSSGFNGPAGIVQLSGLSNQILVTDSQGSRLVNPVDGSSTQISQLVSPSILAQYTAGFGGPPIPFGGGFSGREIDDQGDILVQAFPADGKIHALLLTPPNFNAAPVPEPTTLATLILAAAGGVLRRGLKKSHRTS
jgi:hypothetical protein